MRTIARPQKFDAVKKATAPAYEVEALGQGVVTAIVRDVLDQLLPEPLERVQVREADGRAAMLRHLDG